MADRNLTALVLGEGGQLLSQSRPPLLQAHPDVRHAARSAQGAQSAAHHGVQRQLAAAQGEPLELRGRTQQAVQATSRHAQVRHRAL